MQKSWPLTLSLLALLIAPLSAQRVPDKWFMDSETHKWNDLNHGSFSPEFFDPTMLSIGYMPDGSVHLTETMKPGTAPLPKPPVPFQLSQMRVLRPEPNVAIVTYEAQIPGFHLRASSVWVKRGPVWKTVFYQATRLDK